VVRRVRPDGDDRLAVPRAAASAGPAPGSPLSKLAEAAACAVGGAALAAAAWSVVDLSAAAAIVGGLNGAFSGARRIYRWRSPQGVLAFVLDSSWALITTAGALVVHAVAALQRGRGDYLESLSARHDRHVYAKGVRLRPGFLTTVGNVVSGAARTRRRAVIDVHEQLHVWQARIFGPLYPLIYGVWTLAGSAVGAAVWLASGRRDSLREVVDTIAYYSNPFERWAYRREGRWPPPAAITRLTWPR
jgi:hypothetical protein